MSKDKIPNDPSRRDFMALSAAMGLVAATGVAAAAPLRVVGSDVEIKMSEGVCDAAFFHPTTGSHPGVLIWTDIFGLRPTFRDFGQRLAAQGYSVLVPNPFYRSVKSPVFGDISSFNFQDPASRAQLDKLTAPLKADGAAESDGQAYVAFLDAQPSVNRGKKIGTQGYCMGGPLVVRTAAAVPDRIGAGASFHGGGLVTDQPNSPHLLARKIRATMYFAIASNDDQSQPEAKDKLREAFAAANVPAEIEVYSTAVHGWCVPDMPLKNGAPVYNKPDAERAWNKLLALYQKTLS